MGLIYALLVACATADLLVFVLYCAFKEIK